MIITAELAQQIVDVIMATVQQNINIMNSSGIIMGSGQKKRLNTYHQGAMEVIETGKVVEISPENVDHYPGALPGLNWPIVLDKKVVGVVGISGHPDLVRNTAQLVKMVTELILERESMIAAFRANLQLREQFIQLLLSERCNENLKQITKMASLLRFNVEIPHIVAVVNVEAILEDALHQYGPPDLVTARTRDKLTQIIEASALINSNDLFVVTQHELIILKHFSAETLPQHFYQWGTELIQLLALTEQPHGLCLGMGSLASSLSECYRSYMEASFSQQMHTASAPVASIYEFDILAAYLVKVPGALETCSASRVLKEKIENNLGFKYDMKNTINVLLDHNLNVSSTAKALFIHRNTLVFRIEKLKELTGLNPSQCLNHAILCRLLFGYENR